MLIYCKIGIWFWAVLLFAGKYKQNRSGTSNISQIVYWSVLCVVLLATIFAVIECILLSWNVFFLEFYHICVHLSCLWLLGATHSLPDLAYLSHHYKRYPSVSKLLRNYAAFSSDHVRVIMGITLSWILTFTTFHLDFTHRIKLKCDILIT